MNMTELHTKHHIGPRQGLPLFDASGRTVTCLSGSIWLTMEGDRRDVVLTPGASFVVDRDGLTLLVAQRPSAVAVSAQNQIRSWWDDLQDFLGQKYGPGAIRPSRMWEHF